MMGVWDVFTKRGKEKGALSYGSAGRTRDALRSKGLQAWIKPRATYRWVSGNKAGLDKTLIARLNRVGKELGQPLYVRSGVRSRAEQQALYDAYLAGKGPLAAYPGTSKHERGLAADVQIGSRQGRNIGDVAAARRAMSANGLCLPVAGEKWHVETIESGGAWRS